MATPQLGGASPNANKISIVTKSEIRYEGILYNINPQDQNITLCNVKSFGTEGRRPGNELAPSPQIHDYIIFRGTDIKDLKVLEQGQQSAQPESNTAEQKPTQIQQQTNIQGQNVQQTNESKDIKMKGDSSDFDFNAMQQNFEKFALEHKATDVKVKGYVQDNFFDDLSTSTAEKTREIPFDRMAQKKMDKETFGSEYVDTATHRGGRGGRGRGRGGRGGYNRNYQGGDRNYQGGQNRGYGGQGGYRSQGGYGGNQGGYGGNQGGYGNQEGQSRNYGGYNKGGYKNYGGEQQQGGYKNYGGEQGGYKNYGGEQQGGRKYGGQGNYQGGYQGNRGGYGGHQGGYNQGNQGGYNQGGQGGYNQGNQGGYNQGGQGGGNQGGSKYYKTYVESGQNE